MDQENIDRHLNLFHFFNNNGTQFYEDNLSRALALTLSNDHVFLDRLLRNLLPPELHNKKFNVDDPESRVTINIQKRLNELGSFETVIAVATTPKDITFSQNHRSLDNTKNPVTDIVIELNDVLIIFEVKRITENCTIQLREQYNTLSGSPNIYEVSFSWPDILKLASNVASFEKQVSEVNLFLNDFLSFIKHRYPKWLPTRKFGSIPFPKDPWDLTKPHSVQLNARLKDIKQEMNLGELSYDRDAITVDYDWATEINVMPEQTSEGNFLSVNYWAGDTKAQGYSLYKGGKKLNPIDELNGYQTIIRPYFKFSCYGKGLTWIRDLKPKEWEKTHNKNFFKKITGRWKKEDWGKFDKLLSDKLNGWQDRCNWDDEFIDSNRTYFDLSLGIRVGLQIPYSRIQELDRPGKESELAVELKECAEALKEYIDKDLFV